MGSPDDFLVIYFFFIVSGEDGRVRVYVTFWRKSNYWDPVVCEFSGFPVGIRAYLYICLRDPDDNNVRLSPLSKVIECSCIRNSTKYRNVTWRTRGERARKLATIKRQIYIYRIDARHITKSPSTRRTKYIYILYYS